MSDETQEPQNGDGAADAFAATTVIAVVVLALYIWLSGMPS